MQFQIKNRWTGAVQFECELSAEVAGRSYEVQLGVAVSKAVEGRADLSRANLIGADLSRANLSDADLSDADLSGANLSRANLSGANLSRANLSRANLSRADLSRANLSDADLIGADLSRANLSDADLSRANLSDADLIGADLSRANLSDADLSRADLSRADLSRANLIGADLSRANLSDADLSGIRNDLWDVLLRTQAEVPGLLATLREGRVNGSAYQGECACLVGTIANIRHLDYECLGNGLRPDSNRPIERWFLAIRKGDTPATSSVAKIAEGWIVEFLGLIGAPAAAPQTI